MLKNILKVIPKNVFFTKDARRGLSQTLSRLAEKDNAATKEAETAKEIPQEPPKEVKTVIVENDGPLTLIGINRPEHRNAVNAETARQLCDAFIKFENDDNSSVAVLYGLGGSFCSGYDINELGGENINTDILMQAEGSVGPTRRNIKKPVVCGINGYCVANGLELALMCDLRVMEESAILGFFNRRFGVPVVDGGTTRLPAMIGLSRALDLILTGRQVTAKEAFDFGIANRIVATGTALGQAVNLAYSISKFPQAALNHDRNSIYSAVFDTKSFDQSIQNEIMYTSKAVLDEMKEGVKKFQAGIGRSGKYSHIKEKTMADWEKEEIEHENSSKSSEPVNKTNK